MVASAMTSDRTFELSWEIECLRKCIKSLAQATTMKMNSQLPPAVALSNICTVRSAEV